MQYLRERTKGLWSVKNWEGDRPRARCLETYTGALFRCVGVNKQCSTYIEVYTTQKKEDQFTILPEENKERNPQTDITSVWTSMKEHCIMLHISSMIYRFIERNMRSVLIFGQDMLSLTCSLGLSSTRTLNTISSSIVLGSSKCSLSTHPLILVCTTNLCKDPSICTSSPELGKSHSSYSSHILLVRGDSASANGFLLASANTLTPKPKTPHESWL